jgi:hypothetical protein
MYIYKVFFDKNQVISSQQIPSPFFKSVSIEYSGGKKLIQWLIVYADDEKESIQTAKNVVNDYFNFL